MNWRPEGWKEISFQKGMEASRWNPLHLGQVFELGADAMLEALKSKGAWMSPEQMKLLAPDRKYPYGWLVFIPEKENQATT
jgi:hypothetical protein